GALFDFEMVYTVYDSEDRANLKRVFEAMRWLEHDYLGGQGSRGSGKVEFMGVEVSWHPAEFYQTGSSELIQSKVNSEDNTIQSILSNFENLSSKLGITSVEPPLARAIEEQERMNQEEEELSSQPE